MDLKEKVGALLRAAFDPEELVLDDSDGVTGYLVTPKFEGYDSLERQKMINKVLRTRESGLSRAEQREIFVIAALTPVEAALHTPE